MTLDHVSHVLDNNVQTKVFDVEYHHVSFQNGDDLYLTQYGLPFIMNLLPDSFLTDESWYRNHSEKLRGTSCIYKVKTKHMAGRSLDIVFKWNRMAQDIPGLFDAPELINEEFNSPFEEFALVMELRNTRSESPGQVLTHKPLAIYVRGAHVDLDRLGRKAYKMKSLMSLHGDVGLAMNRNYAVIYEWTKGLDAVQACQEGLLSEPDIEAVTLRSRELLERKGFFVGDSKPHHVIVRQADNGRLLRDRQGEILYALVDFELLKRTPVREKQIRVAKRKTYLRKQAQRFEAREGHVFPPNLAPVNILGVDYVFGRVEGMRGALWVVGKDPTLFDYFLPEQWRETRRIKLAVFDQVFRTTTKNDIHLVWKVSRVGEIPDMDPFDESEQRIIDHGYNSPFEEVALALELEGRGIPSTYPRAIYMASSKSEMHESLCDERRYESHKGLLTPGHQPILKKNHDYIIFWGYWNGPDELLALKDESPYEGVDVLFAYRKGLVDKGIYLHLMELMKAQLLSLGIEDLNPKGNHILLSVDRSDNLARDALGIPEMRLFNFELLQRLSG